MLKLKQNTIILVSICLLILTSCKNEKKNESQNPMNQQETTAKKGERKIIFENDYSMVVKIKLNPDEFISPPGGKGKDRVVYSLSDYSLDWEKEDKNMETQSWKKGDVHFHKAGKHFVKNSGTSKAEYIVFVKKNNNLPEYNDTSLNNDVNSVAPEFAKNLLDNDDFKLTEVTLPQGQSISLHSGINRVIYPLSNYQIMYESDNGDNGEKSFETGNAHWHEASQHSLKNNGNTVAKYLVVSLK